MQFFTITNILKSCCGSVFYAYLFIHILLVFNDSWTIDGAITRAWKASGNFGSTDSILLSFSAWLSFHWHVASQRWSQLYTLFFLPFIKNKPRFLGESISFPDYAKRPLVVQLVVMREHSYRMPWLLGSLCGGCGSFVRERDPLSPEQMSPAFTITLFLLRLQRHKTYLPKHINVIKIILNMKLCNLL